MPGSSHENEIITSSSYGKNLYISYDGVKSFDVLYYILLDNDVIRVENFKAERRDNGTYRIVPNTKFKGTILYTDRESEAAN